MKPTPADRIRAQLVVGLSLSLGVLACALGLIAWGRIPSRAAYDQMWFHEPAIRRFMADFPRIDVADYLSATTPGYHILLAAVGVLTGGTRELLQVGSAFIGAVLVFLVGWNAGRAGARGAAFALPVAGSVYVLSSAAWLLPDNTGWLGVLAVLLCALQAAGRGGCWIRWTALGAVCLLLLVLSRQVHLWTAAALWTAAWIAPVRSEHAGEPGWKELAFGDMAIRARRAAAAIALTLPAFLALGGLFTLWGGDVVPPSFQNQYSGSNPAGAAFILSVIGCYSVFFVPTLVSPLLELFRRHRGWLLLALAIGVVLSLGPATTFDFAAGRRTGLWNLAARFPTVGGRTSLLIVPLALWGAVALAAWLRGLGARDRLIVLGSIVAFSTALSAGPEVWQRYVDPLVLILLAVMAGRVSPVWTPRRSLLSRIEPVGPVLLGLLLLGVMGMSLRDSRPLDGDPPPLETPDRVNVRESPIFRYYDRRGEPVPGPIVETPQVDLPQDRPRPQ